VQPTPGTPRAITADLAWVNGSFQRGVSFEINDGVITGVSRSGDGATSATLEDWGAVALVPGTVNAHGHAFQNLFKGFSDDFSFDRWRDDVLYPFSERLSGDDIYAGALFAFAEALVAGVTTIVDFFYA
jgi:5-methylthioadenosine/S-adenosylhomocysteine deaminase